MNQFDPHDLAEWAEGTWLNAEMPKSISGFCFDTRQLSPGECFVALSTDLRDGHVFAAQATDRGAAALLVEQPQALALAQLVVNDSLLAMAAIGTGIRQGFSGPIVGITGSCGKTSTKEMLRLLLGKDRTHATAGNWNNRIGVPMTLFGLDEERHDFAVIEAGINQPNEMAHLGSMVQADIVVITNIAAAHLELLGSVEQVALEKAELVLRARADAPLVLPNSVFQHANFTAFAERAVLLAAEGEAIAAQAQRVIRYRLNLAGSGYSSLYLQDASTIEKFQIASPSAGICMNAALAILSARELGIADDLIRERIRSWRPLFTRGSMVTRAKQTFYIDCYNANPASMRDAIAAFCRAMPPQQARCYVLGAMNELGEQSAELHRQVGRQLALRAEDQARFVGPDALTQAYYDGAIEAGGDPAQLARVTDIEKIKSVIANFDGSFLLKGSRSYGLEVLLPPESR